MSIETGGLTLMNREIAGKHALITGSVGVDGIGFGIARRLAREGVNITLHGFGGDVEQAKAEIAEYGVEVDYNGSDLRYPDQIEAMMVEDREKYGGSDILVLNAGKQFVSSIQNCPPEQYDEIIAINQTAPWLSAHYAIPNMLAKDWGRIIVTASAHALVGSADKSPYVMSKHAVLGMVKAVALELAETPITANAICPGWVPTALVEKQIMAKAEREGCTSAEAARLMLLEKQPSGKFVMASQIGGAAIYLCSSDATETRGTAIVVDGGWTAR
ncbi:MAG: 3-hydroxybutyrate dehydrogenase [Candidatus Saccharibacteria bacterium]